MNVNQDFQKADYPQEKDMSGAKQGNVVNRAIVTRVLNKEINSGKAVEGNSFLKDNNGLGQDELNGLELEERKRKRVGPGDSMICGYEDNSNIMDSVLSHIDCTETSASVLAQLARKESQPQ